MKDWYNFEDDLRYCLSHSLEALGIDSHRDVSFSIEIPKDSRFGDFSTNIALKLSTATGKSAPEIANSLVDSLKKDIRASILVSNIESIKVVGGFINFFLNSSYFYNQLAYILNKKENFGRADFGRQRKVLIEFVSANPTGPLSVAHARQAAVGDALANILSFLNFSVKKEYYLNDEGNQINILGKSIELRTKELSGEKVDFPEDYYQGDYIYEIAKDAAGGKVKVQDLSNFGVKYILKIIKQELGDFGVRFDSWYSQKDLRKSGKIKKTLDFIKVDLYQQEDAVWLKSTKFGDDKDRVVIKSDGSYTYLAPDIAYHDDKYKRKFQWLINLWGPDHHGYIKRLKAAVSSLGEDPDSLSIIIVQLASIFRAGRPIEMSTRKGQYVTLQEVLKEVGKDAARFFFLMRRTDSHLVFDLELAKKQTPENPVYYIQYAYARICGILSNAKKINGKEIKLDLLKEQEEATLIKRLSEFPHTLSIILKTLDPYSMTVYLQSLAADFHRFYDRHRVLKEEETLCLARLALVQATRIVLENGLGLLGVSAPEKM